VGVRAGLRLAALAVTETTDRDAFLAQFSGNESSVADYLVGEVLSGLPDDVQEFLRVISISEPVPSRLAAELSGREEAASLLDGLEHQTSPVPATGAARRLPYAGGCQQPSDGGSLRPRTRLFTGVTVGLTPGYSPDSAATRPELIASTNARWSRSF
jgi:hypothetical protein